MSELDEEQQLEDEELQPPRSKTPSPPCPASKVSALCLPSTPLSCPPGPDPGLSVLPPGSDPALSIPPPGSGPGLSVLAPPPGGLTLVSSVLPPRA